jgi:hypothetical protein
MYRLRSRVVLVGSECGALQEFVRTYVSAMRFSVDGTVGDFVACSTGVHIMKHADSIFPTAFSIRATLDGSTIDLLLFQERQDAEAHACYIRDNCRLLGFESLAVVERTVIGPPR